MFLLNEDIKNLDSNFTIVQALSSINTQNVLSSNSNLMETNSFLIAGHLNDIPYIYAIFTFKEFNDMYNSDDIILNQNDLEKTWKEGINFLEDMGFILDEIDNISLKESQIFNLNSKINNGDINENIITYLSSF